MVAPLRSALTGQEAARAISTYASCSLPGYGSLPGYNPDVEF